MSGTGLVFANDLMKLVFQGVAIPNIADNAASSPIANLFVALHTADPSSGDQTTSEAAYPGYARVAQARTSSGWTVSGNVVSPPADIVFPTAGAGASETETFFSVGVAGTGASKIMFSGPLTPNISVASGTAPKVKASTTITEN
jgi:hypothetical protein